MSNQELLKLAIEAAHAAGRVIIEKRSSFSVLASQGKDLKSEADLASEKAIFSFLDTTGIPSLSEESRADTKIIEKGRMWIVDPLDGTVNFTRGLPLFCVSIGLWEDGKPLLGVIYEPVTNQTFAGLVGEGATLNGSPVRTAEISDPGQAVLCTGFPTGRSYDQEDLVRFVKSVQKFKKVRLLGSAALCLAYISAGLVDAYCEEDIWLWDVAAGLAIIAAAGGSVQYGPWSGQLKSRVIATNGSIAASQLAG
ncbi:inositol monophosphatase family protein [Lacunimicrobium album]